MCGGEVSDNLLVWMESFGTRKQHHINQCELLAVLVDVMTCGDLFRGRDI
jgi:hypothetical protein